MLISSKDCSLCGKMFLRTDSVYIVVKTLAENCGNRWISQPGKTMNDEMKNMELNTLIYHETCYKNIAGESNII